MRLCLFLGGFALCLRCSLAQLECSSEEEGLVLNGIVDLVLERQNAFEVTEEVDEYSEGASALLAGGWTPQCKTLSLLARNKNSFVKQVNALIKKLDDEHYGGLPESTMAFVRGVVDHTMSASSAPTNSMNVYGRLLNNPHIQPQALQVVQNHGAHVLKRALRSPAVRGLICGTAGCPGASQLAGTLGLKALAGAGVALVVIPAAYEVFKVLQEWRSGNIDGTTAFVQISGGAVDLAGGLAGAQAGATLGAPMGPMGALMGGILGGTVGAASAGTATRALLTRWFDISPEENLQKCYSDLKLKASASNAKVNRAYREVARKAHPDQGGSQDAMLKVTMCLELIKAERSAYEQERDEL